MRTETIAFITPCELLYYYLKWQKEHTKGQSITITTKKLHRFLSGCLNLRSNLCDSQTEKIWPRLSRKIAVLLNQLAERGLLRKLGDKYMLSLKDDLYKYVDLDLDVFCGLVNKGQISKADELRTKDLKGIG